MSNLAIHFHLLLFLGIPVLLCSGRLAKPQPPKSSNKTAALFVFGDSVFEPGNNNYIDISIAGRADFPPYGETFFEFPTGRHCDGRTVPDFVALYMGLPYLHAYLDPNNTDYLVGANFASAGAGVLESSDPDVIYLELQVSYMEKVASSLKEQLGDDEAAELLSGAIYLTSLGGVDYMSFSNDTSNPTEAEMKDFVDEIIGNFTIAIKAIYDLGGRKFAFQNVGSLGCQPEQKQSYNTSGCVAALQTLAIMHNDALNTLAADLATELSGFQYLIFDYFTTVMDRTEDPTTYGFVEGDVACCGYGTHRADYCGYLTYSYELCSDPSEYVFFDGGHPTEATNSQLIDLLWSGTNYTKPINLSQLLALESANGDDALIKQQVARSNRGSKSSL